MSQISVRRVETKNDLRTFIDFHYDLYKGNKYDVPNLFSDDFATLCKEKNAAFDFCEAEYYLAYDQYITKNEDIEFKNEFQKYLNEIWND